MNRGNRLFGNVSTAGHDQSRVRGLAHPGQSGHYDTVIVWSTPRPRATEDLMLNFNRNDRPNDLKDPKLSNRPAPLGPQPAAGMPLPPSPPRTAVPPAVPEPPVLTATATAADMPGSRLSIGVNINLKGVEISNCDVLVIEGNVEATINSKAMEIAKPGRLTGTAIIDVAEIHGDFSGELTARGKLIVHSTGRVTGTIRYGKLVVAEGGTVNGELKQLEPAQETSPVSPALNPKLLLNPQPH